MQTTIIILEVIVLIASTVAKELERRNGGGK